MDYISSLFHNQCAVIEQSSIAASSPAALAPKPMRGYRLDVAIGVPNSWSTLFCYNIKKVDVDTGLMYTVDLDDPELENCWLGNVRILGCDISIRYDANAVKSTWSQDICNKFCKLLSCAGNFGPCCLEISRISVVHTDTNQLLETLTANRSFTEVAILKVQHLISIIETGLRNWINSGNLVYLTVEDSAIQMDFTSSFITQPQVLKIIDGSENDDSLSRILEYWHECPQSLQGKEVKLRLPPKFEICLEKFGKTMSKDSKSSKSFVFIQHEMYSDCVVIVEVFSVLKANLLFR